MGRKSFFTLSLLKVLSNGKGGGGVNGINRKTFKYSTLPPIKQKIKGPRPFKQQKTFLSAAKQLLKGHAPLKTKSRRAPCAN
jgi:hypothetical protein